MRDSSEDSTVISRFFLPISLSEQAIQLPDKELRYLRTVIVTVADIHEGLRHGSLTPCGIRPAPFDLLALVKRRPLYILLRVSRELCFW